MSVESQHLENIRDIRQLMQNSSRFVSLSGLSGIAAGLCALVAAWVARNQITEHALRNGIDPEIGRGRLVFREGYQQLELRLLLIAAITLAAAFLLAFLFTWLRSRKTGLPIWGFVARKVMVSVLVPMVVGGLLIWRMMDFGAYALIAPACLLFYGLGLINASKFTFSEIRYLGYGQLVLGILNLWRTGYGLIFWAIGFGVLHIIYGFLMWWKNERKPSEG